MSQYAEYKKEARKNSPRKRRDVGVEQSDLKAFAQNLEIFQTGSRLGPDPVQTGSRLGPDPVQTGSRLGPDPVQTVPLTKPQYQVYKFFRNNGRTGSFNRTAIHSNTGVAKATIKAAILKFKKFKIIELGPLCSVKKTQAYTLDLGVPISCGEYDSLDSQQGGVDPKESELQQLKERLFDAEYKVWCLENPHEVLQIHETSIYRQETISSPLVQVCIKGEFRKLFNKR